ncbi:phage integrase SAM-like domain-containing protein [Spirosoma sp. KCTC 42546]|uniref:phage integrase SAM-like domain-containing protein n=1 Tax=Spirosoma sp. KCTC 42546 TaxID=2520506 RepID=UPI001FEED4FB|nr:phage integrase SAM-like domain-containing protein [Spirosoma sp. KCTC 42546]
MGSTGIMTYHDYWDEDQKQITSQDPEAFFKNEQLDIMRNQLRATFNDLFRKKEKITAAKVRRAFLGENTQYTPLDAFQMYLKDSAADTDRDLEKTTLGVYDNVRKKLTDFLISEKATDLLIEDFDLVWVKKFRRCMKQVPLGVGQIGHADSYIIKQTQTIKNVLIWAKLHKLADSNPREGRRIKGPEWDDLVFLSLEQFEQLRAHTFENQSMQQVADVFIILCRCGFHYGDLEDFRLATNHWTSF